MMTQKVLSPSKSHFCSVIRVDKDIDFVLDNSNLEFPYTVPAEKSIKLSRRTYSKKNPAAFPRVSFRETLKSVPQDLDLKLRKERLNCFMKTSNNLSINKNLRKKRIKDTCSKVVSNFIHKKVGKKENSHSKMIPQKPDNTCDALKHKAVKGILNGHESSDSDVEVLEVKLIKPGPSNAKFPVQVRNSVNSDSKMDDSKVSIKRKCKEYKSPEESSKKKCTVKQMSQNMLKPCYPSSDNVLISEADTAPVIRNDSFIPNKTTNEVSRGLNSSSPVKWLSANGSISLPHFNDSSSGAKETQVNYADKYNLFLPEMKVVQEKKSSGKRELRHLYENLNEISWANEKSFKQLLFTGDEFHRHSARLTAKVTTAGKNLRRPKNASVCKEKYIVNKKNTSKHLLALRQKKLDKFRTNVKVSKPLAKNAKLVLKPKTKKHPKEKKSVTSINKSHTKEKVVQPKIMSKIQDSNVSKGKPKVGTPGTKDSANSGMKYSSGKTNEVQETSQASTSKSSVIKNALKKFEKIEVANEIELFRSVLNADNDVFSAFQRGSKLRVTLEPLEHTNLWTTDFYETFKKHVIEQALFKSIEKRDQESINSMFRDLQDSFMAPPNNIKVPKKKKPEEETLRSSVRQSEGAFRYKEIVVKRHQNYMQFVLVPNPSKQNSLTIEAMKELKDAFLLAKRDSNCRAVLLNSSGTYFCTGIDLSQLIGNNKKQVAEEMASTIRDLVMTLGTFTKPVVAAVNGTAVGFGVSLLTYCDVVLASDKATFCIPATRLGYLPEGAVTLTLPQVVGAGVATEMLLQGRRLTAEQALRYGLVSEVLWPTQLMNEVIPRIQTIVSQPLQVMEATKSMVRCHLWDKLKPHVVKEWQLLPPLWLGAQCQHNIKRTLQTGWLID